LKFLCEKLGIFAYFKSIHGSPTNKNQLVENVLLSNGYMKYETILIGDSINDYEAAKANNIDFYGFNNPNLASISSQYLDDYNDLQCS
jgi:phosphoglycolate phosphatase-like HAD superfamily hydrolase